MADADAEPRAVRAPLEPRLERATYTPAPLAIINGMLLYGASRVYRYRFGVGINEWRMLGRLATSPGCTSAEAITEIGLNKAIVSRSMAVLLQRGLIVTETRGRVRHMYLTPEGAELYQRMREVAEERERILLAGLSAREARALRGALARMMEQGPALFEYDSAQVVGPGVSD